MLKKLLLPLWILGAVLLFLYSFTQVDLSLTLTKIPFVQPILSSFQYVGWFNRPLSAVLYLLLFSYLLYLYWKTLKFQLTRKALWTIILSVTGILIFSYNAFSYDLFNYIFDARIITFYGKNPYEFTASHFQGDPMLTFMRWTHRTYPYGPVWLLLTAPLTFVANEFFLGTVFLFKSMAAGFFLLSCFFIEKIANLIKIDSKKALAFFSLNPFVLVESLVSAHNDMVMIALSLISIFLLFKSKYISSAIFFASSVGIKFATLFLLPAYVVFYKKRNYELFIRLSFYLMAGAILLASLRTTFQPWYLLYILFLLSLLVKSKPILRFSFIASILAMLNYLPFLYFGVYGKETEVLMLVVNLAIAGVGLWIFKILFFDKKNILE